MKRIINVQTRSTSYLTIDGLLPSPLLPYPALTATDCRSSSGGGRLRPPLRVPQLAARNEPRILHLPRTAVSQHVRHRQQISPQPLLDLRMEPAPQTTGHVPHAL